MSREMLVAIRGVTNRVWVLGSGRFRDRLARKIDLGQRLLYEANSEASPIKSSLTLFLLFLTFVTLVLGSVMLSLAPASHGERIQPSPLSEALPQYHFVRAMGTLLGCCRPPPQHQIPIIYSEWCNAMSEEEYEVLVILDEPHPESTSQALKSKFAVSQIAYLRVLILRLKDKGQAEEVRSYPGVLSVNEESFPQDLLEGLSTSESLFVEAWNERWHTGGKKRPGEGLDWDMEGFKPPDDPEDSREPEN